MKRFWITADLHLGHSNIVKGISNWKDKAQCRDFETLNDHDDRIIQNINYNVAPDDVLYIVGDFCFGKKEQIFFYRRRIKCKNIHLIKGNHDKVDERISIPIPNYIHNWDMEKINTAFEKFKITRYVIYDNLHAFPVHYSGDGVFMMWVKNLFSSICESKMVNFYGAKNVYLHHFAHEVWDRSHYGTYHFHGHSHGRLPSRGNRLDVGIDGAFSEFGQYRPFEVKEALKIIENYKYVNNRNKK